MSLRWNTAIRVLPNGDLGACIDHDAQVLLTQKLLSELARDAATRQWPSARGFY